jgi:hypothetical protein
MVEANSEKGRLRRDNNDYDVEQSIRDQLEAEQAKAAELAPKYEQMQQDKRAAIGEKKQGLHRPLPTKALRSKEDVEETIARRVLVLVWRDKAYPLGSPQNFERHQKSIGGFRDAMVEFRGTKEGALITEGFEPGQATFTLADFTDVGSNCVAVKSISVPTTGRLHRVQLSASVAITTPASLLAAVAVLQRGFSGDTTGFNGVLADAPDIIYASDNQLNPTFQMAASVPFAGLDRNVDGSPHYVNTDDGPKLSGMLYNGDKLHQIYVMVVLGANKAAIQATLALTAKVWPREVV